MAFCPECNQKMGQTDVVCPHCGYDFPPLEGQKPEPSGMAYSNLAEAALMIGAAAAGVACVFCLVATVFQILSLHILQALGAIIGFFLSLANFVVFVRIRDIADRGTQ